MSGLFGAVGGLAELFRGNGETVTDNGQSAPAPAVADVGGQARPAATPPVGAASDASSGVGRQGRPTPAG